MTKQEAQEFNNMGKRITRLEKQLSDFTEMLHERQQGDVDFIAMEVGVDLDYGEDEEPEDMMEEEGE